MKPLGVLPLGGARAAAIGWPSPLMSSGTGSARASPFTSLRRPPDGQGGAVVRAALLAGFALLGASAAHANLWGYVDGTGVAHVATTQIDSRYWLVLGERAAPEALVPGKTDHAASLLTWLEIAPEVRALRPLLRQAAREQGVDAELLEAIIVVESGFNGRVVSPRGAVGLMQITPETADRYTSASERQRPAAERLLDARDNVRTGARMLADLTRRFGGIDVALAAWNAGEGAVRKAGGKMPAIDETRAHVQLVLELYWALLQNNLSRHVTALKIHTDLP